MSKVIEQLQEVVRLKKQLANNLTAQGVLASENETLNTLVPKVSSIVRADEDIKLGILDLTEDGEYYAVDQGLAGWSHVNNHTLQPYDFVSTFTTGTGSSIRFKIKALKDEIKPYSFQSLSKLAEADLSNVKTIGSYAFGGCSSMTRVIAPSPLVVDSYAFNGCTVAEGIITISPKQTNIPTYMAYNCKKLQVVLHDDITAIGTYAFYNNDLFDYSHFPTNLETIGGRAFYSSSTRPWTIEEIYFPGKLRQIDTYAFYYHGFKKIHIPDSCTKIGSYAFRQGIATEIEIGKGIEEINNYAFYNNNLSKIIIHALTPPTIQTNTFLVQPDAVFYVPASALNDYKSASNWSKFADRMVGLEGE